MNALALHNRVQFTLKSKEFESIELLAPIGFTLLNGLKSIYFSTKWKSLGYPNRGS